MPTLSLQYLLNTPYIRIEKSCNELNTSQDQSRIVSNSLQQANDQDCIRLYRMFGFLSQNKEPYERRLMDCFLRGISVKQLVLEIAKDAAPHQRLLFIPQKTLVEFSVFFNNMSDDEAQSIAKRIKQQSTQHNLRSIDIRLAALESAMQPMPCYLRQSLATVTVPDSFATSRYGFNPSVKHNERMAPASSANIFKNV